MERYGNIRFNRRVVVTLCLLVVAVNFLMPKQIVQADTISKKGNLSFDYYRNKDGVSTINLKYVSNHTITCDSPVYSFIIMPSDISGHDDKLGDYYYCYIGYASASAFSVAGGDFSYNSSGENYVSTMIGNGTSNTSFCRSNVKFTSVSCYSSKPSSLRADIVINCLSSDLNSTQFNKLLSDKLDNFIFNGVKSDGVMLNVGQGYQAQNKAYSEIGCLDNVQMETYITNKKEMINADDNADLSKINQDKVIVYSSTSTTGIDLSKGGYKVQLYGSYAWQDKSGHIKSEDKGHKTFIKDWNAENNIKGLNRSNYTWIDWKSANNKVESDKTDNAHKPNVFEKMTTYANYQYEPIWYLRIVSQDNKYGAWVKLYNSSKKGKYTSEAVDDNDNSVSDSDGGYSKPKDTSEITGTGDTPEDAKNNVQKTEEKQDNKDIQDASGGSNSTFDKLEEFTKGIGDVPKMIADIFSFLPSWCLEVVAIGFALLIVLIVVKFIRG